MCFRPNDWAQLTDQAIVEEVFDSAKSLNQPFQLKESENEDNLTTYYLYGRITYILLDIEPIEEAGLTDLDDPYAEPIKEHATLTDVFQSFNHLMD